LAWELLPPFKVKRISISRNCAAWPESSSEAAALSSALAVLHRTFNQFAGFGGSLGVTGSKVTDFFGDHGKPFAVLSIVGCFNLRIEGQQVGLEGDYVNDFDGPGNTMG